MVICTGKKLIFTIGLIVGGIFNSISYGQQSPVIEGSDIKPFTASGSIGISANAYNAWGIQNRRAPASVQTTANMNFSLFGLSSGASLLYSTDQSRFRQNMNSLSFNASWKWFTVQAGSVSPNFSEYGINGATIRGGYFKANPGKWELELSGGRSMRRVKDAPQPELRRSAYERWAVAGKAGYQLNSNNSFRLSTHYSVDRQQNLGNIAGLTPQENLTITPDVEVSLLDGILDLTSELTISAYTRDLSSPEIPVGGVGLPPVLGSMMQAHTSSRITYAGQASASLNLNPVALELNYERIQPGFVSLGVGTIRDDEQNIRVSPSVQLLDNKLSLQSSIALGRDNLLGTRLQTRRNTVVGTNGQFQLTDRISINGNYNLLINDFSSNFDAGISSQQGVALDQRQMSHTLMLQPTFTFQREQRTHNISLTGSYFLLNNEFKGSGPSIPDALTSDTYSGSVAYSLVFPTGFSITTMGNVLSNSSNSTQNTAIGANIGASYSLFERSLTLSLNGGINQNTNKATSTGGENINVKARQLMLNLTSSYRLTNKDSFSLTVRSRGNSMIQGGSNSYSELEGSFNYQHRF